MTKWERNKTWYMEVWLIVLTIALVFSLLIGFIGWIKYIDTLKLQMESEQVIGNFFKSIE